MRESARKVWRQHVRYRGLQLSLLLGALAVMARGFQLQVLDSSRWRARAIAQHETRVPLPAPRGAIYDREGRELAVSRTTYRVSVAPRELADPMSAARVLGRTLSVRSEVLRRVAESQRPWVVMPGRYSAVVKEELEARVGSGVYFEPVVERFYPRGDVASEVLGRVDATGRGQSGLELTFDSILAGHPGFGIRRRDATGASANWLTTVVATPTAGTDLWLTIDAELQALAESVLEDAVSAADAEGGDLLILEPESGELLAAASRRRGGVRHLAAVTEPYEPGSTLKPFIAAAVLAEDLAGLSDTVDTGAGEYRTAGRIVHDVHPHGRLSFAEVLEVSSNVGMAKLAERLTRGQQYAYLRDFGFGTPTGLEYPAESPGKLRQPGQWSRQSQASLAIGYEIAVTPLQLTMAYGAIANGGILMRPRLVREAVDPEGETRWQRSAESLRRVVPEQIASRLRDVLARAVTRGTGRSAGVKGLSVAGKTGTALRFDPRRGYGSGVYTASFVGLVPSDAPELVIMVKLDAPSGAYYGGSTAAPVMRTAVRAALAGSHWPAPPLLGEPVIPEAMAGVSAERAPAGGTYVFALDAPLTRANPEASADGASLHRGVVPDVRGLPLRTAVKRVHGAGWRVIVRGSGRVASMRPAPGSRPRAGEAVELVAERG